MSILARVKTFFGLRKTSDQSDLFSIVLLLRQPLPLSEQDLERAAIKAWGRELQSDPPEYVTLQSNRPGTQVGFIRFENLIILVNNISNFYVSPHDLPEVLKEFPEMRTQRALREHTAWLSFDLMLPKPPRRKDKNHFYRRACALAAEFVDDNCLGLSVSETHELRPYDNHLKAALHAENPVSALREWDRVPLVDDEAPQMQEAVNEAQRRWPEFEKAFRIRRAGQHFLVKTPFSERDEGKGEWMWIEMLSFSEGVVEGKLLNRPVHVRSVREGETVRIPTSAIGDWIYNEGGKVHGGFTDKVLGKPKR